MWPQLVEPVEDGLERRPGFAKETGQPLAELVERRLYFDIVEKTQELIAAAEEPRTNAELEALLEVWVWRFRALLATRQGALVAQEAQSRMDQLEELPASAAVWDLRLLLVPVRSKGINRTALQILYGMATEARMAMLEYPEEVAWAARLRRLGLEVAAVLVGMRDLPTAIHHLESVYGGEVFGQSEWAGTVAHAITMCYLHLGSPKADEWAARSGIDTALVRAFGREEYEWIESVGEPEAAHCANIRALAALHLGRPEVAIERLEAALETEPSAPLLFNLFMTYDLVESNPNLQKQRRWEELAARYGALSTYVI